jgi:hypothetical protein
MSACFKYEEAKDNENFAPCFVVLLYSIQDFLINELSHGHAKLNSLVQMGFSEDQARMTIIKFGMLSFHLAACLLRHAHKYLK